MEKKPLHTTFTSVLAMAVASFERPSTSAAVERNVLYMLCFNVPADVLFQHGHFAAHSACPGTARMRPEHLAQNDLIQV